jgi:hypothetical protein
VSEESDIYVNADLSQSENSSDEPLGNEVMQDMAELGVPAMGGSVMPPSLSNKHHSGVDRVGQSTSMYAPHDSPDLPGHPPDAAVCAMCGNIHQGTCDMTERSENLVHYRRILFTEQTGESFGERVRPLNIHYL